MRAFLFALTVGVALLHGELRGDELPESWKFTGQTHAAMKSTIKARVSGEVTQVTLRPGDFVQKGDFLFEIDPRPYQLDVQAAQARTRRAEARLNTARINYENSRNLLNKQLTTEETMRLAEAAVQEAEAEFELARTELEQTQLTLSWTRGVAPMHGIVGEQWMERGDVVEADRTPLMTIVSVEHLRVSFQVPEHILLNWRRRSVADAEHLSIVVGFSGDDEPTHLAKLTSIEPEIDPKSKTVTCWAELPNDEQLFSPGMTAWIVVTAEDEN